MTTTMTADGRTRLRDRTAGHSDRECLCGPPAQRYARLASKGTAWIAPAVLLALLPKCPLCLAAWLTVATGFGVTATGVTWLRAGIVLLWIAAVVPFLWRRVLRRADGQAGS